MLAGLLNATFGNAVEMILAVLALRRGLVDVVQGSFSCEHGGKWGTALNTENFVRVWQAMDALGQWRNHDWIIKNDADAVFFPPRFLDLVTGRSGLMAAVPTGPVYLNNCQWGMHGPVEAVNNEAMGMYFQSGTTVCADILQRAMTAELPAGADEAHLITCLNVLDARRDSETRRNALKKNGLEIDCETVGPRDG